MSEQAACQSELDDVLAEINAMNFALKSFEKHSTNEARIKFLKEHINQFPYLSIYLRFSEDELKTFLKIAKEKEMIIVRGERLKEEALKMKALLFKHCGKAYIYFLVLVTSQLPKGKCAKKINCYFLLFLHRDY